MAQIEVVVAAYNAQAYIQETLDSLLAQGEGVRIRVVDDGSTDATAQIVRRYVPTGRVSYHYQANSGQSSIPRNHGLAEVCAPFVTFFDADDVMLPGHLHRQIQILECHPAAAAAVANYRNFSSEGEEPDTHFSTCPQLNEHLSDRQLDESGHRLVLLQQKQVRLVLADENFAINGSIVYRTALLKKLGGFDNQQRNSEDFDLIWRTSGQGPLAVSDALAMRRRLHPDSKSSNTERVLQGKVITRKKLLAAELDPQVRCKLKGALARFLDASAVHQANTHAGSAIRVWLRALPYGLAAGTVPVQLPRQLARRCLFFGS